MPSQARSRDRYRSDRDRDRSYRRYRNDGDDEFVYDESPDERRRHRAPRHVRGESRDYDSQDQDVDDDRGYEEDPMMVDSRRRLAEPAPIRSSPRHERGGESSRRRERSKAKESPATSPIKKRDRERDREGHRRRERALDYDGSPTRGARVRERRHRDLDMEDNFDRDRELERELRRQRRRERDRERERERYEREVVATKHTSADSANSSSQLLSSVALSKIDTQYERNEILERELMRKEEKKQRRRERDRGFISAEDTPPQRSRKSRIVSGAIMEEGRSPHSKLKGRGGGGPEFEERWRKEGGDEYMEQQKAKKKKKWIWIAIGVVIILLIIIIPTAVVVSKKKSNDSSDSSSSSGDSNSNLKGISPDSIPASAKGTVLDPFTWYTTTDFNVTYTNETVGGLPIMGLNSTWDDSARPNPNVPPLNQNFTYGKTPIRGVNLGGWLSIEPFITPSLFDSYSSQAGVIDEYTLSQKLGQSAASTIEKHYATFITEQDFQQIAQAGLDHVRIQYSYWAVTTYDGDPYVPKIAWRYLLRAIEYCRKYGLRVNLDLHGIPGSQNGWNHSGRQGTVGWLNGTDGDLNRQRSIDIHNQLSQFFAQPRYKNVVTIYGLVNEPKMLSLPIESVLNWTTQVTELVQKNGITAWIAFGDGFLNLAKWHSMLKDGPPNMLLDTHQYTIFNTGEIGMNHTAKINLICTDWVGMIGQVDSTSAGWGPTICGEWSQSDTDCAQFLNNVGWGTRWTGTYDTGDSDTSVTTPLCPTSPNCECSAANADPTTYSDDYKKWLLTYAEAQMFAYEKAHGWFYWTWKTESAAQWSYQTAWQNGFMPKLAYQPDFTCGEIPSFGSLPENY
ncbi:CAZyme family GH5 [Paecilomyces variotii]|nr:CAZyme family GH5 [Paecilomyces variotii]KAJ9276608.1 CAZyme family GH5 [Paecilomyces variotii]KAJ9291250.1 CAZyme family GH5 [Paecilomyces variotii]KAJ9340572.1 CAZyme family GH5 [Paecilomyces variotii]KAJ9379597.1 CAZyme family GH5 [Paecilomyces variotii]